MSAAGPLGSADLLPQRAPFLDGVGGGSGHFSALDLEMLGEAYRRFKARCAAGTISTLDIDKYAAMLADPSDGRMLLDSSGVLYLVDVRTPQLPRVQAAVPHDTGPVAFGHGQLIVSDELGFHSYATVLENLIP